MELCWVQSMEGREGMEMVPEWAHCVLVEVRVREGIGVPGWEG